MCWETGTNVEPWRLMFNFHCHFEAMKSVLEMSGQLAISS